ncbi:methyltransferase domain-containing protein [Halodesulfurarchaeum sp. HSR-GB]|uniref:methyltransferase domain-containing protein n=1 Tax=Halodesulfurarchaeum sp. HSR-GB TaxID=3074077 RepID=UPI002860D074|nr:methyltransferase domain-containing protein [Halodesulfurarchaeum sp. HSR-GB]MDR5655995.1 methyltransferase domain-containing protein [Halodesulfurarchaeum sp. HSR-GB]
MYVLEFAGEDDPFAAAEARAAATDVEILAPGLGRAETVTPDRARGLAFTRRVSEAVGTSSGGPEAAVSVLKSAPLDRSGSIAVRARDVRGTAGIDTQQAERRLGQVLVDRGFAVDLSNPDHTLVALFADDLAVLGWEVLTAARDYGRQPTDRPFFQPGSMDPRLARAVLNLAGVGPADRVLDPMCGTGGLLIEAGRLGGTPIGFDAQEKMVRGTRQNLQAALDGSFLVARGDATALPLPDDSVDAVVFDAPYGRQSKIATHGLETLVRGALVEARRVSSRAVVVADRAYDQLAREAGWTLRERHDRRVHRSLTRFVHVLAPR